MEHDGGTAETAEHWRGAGPPPQAGPSVADRCEPAHAARVQPVAAVAAEPSSGGALRRLLVGLDVGALLVAWSVALVVPARGSITGPGQLLSVLWPVLALTALGVALITSQRLYQSRVCAVKVVEHTRLARAATGSGVVAWLAGALTTVAITPWSAAAGAAGSFVLLVVVRGGYRAWLRQLRGRGHLAREVVLVGSGAEGYRLYELLREHPELGFRVAGVVGDRAAALRHGFDAPFLGGVDEAVDAVRRLGASGAVVAATCLGSDELSAVVRRLLAADVHVHVSTGLRGVAHRRLRSQSFAYEPMFYLEQAALGPWQLAAKRVLDVAVAAVVLVLALPVLAAAALAIKLDDRGAVIFRQQRVGRNGQLFTMYKLRTMVSDAEERLELLRTRNERSGPLFKLADDPRVTRVGRLLRGLHVDELPQLLNVLQGTMSLVGPRPALPEEVEHFSEELQARTRILPGITGLWQIEANDKPQFSAYERLDLFYVENWSVGLDVAVLFSTVEMLLAQAVTDVRRSRRRRRVRLTRRGLRVVAARADGSTP